MKEIKFSLDLGLNWLSQKKQMQRQLIATACWRNSFSTVHIVACKKGASVA